MRKNSTLVEELISGLMKKGSLSKMDEHLISSLILIGMDHDDRLLSVKNASYKKGYRNGVASVFVGAVLARIIKNLLK